jgi:hypothetical protein
MIEEEGADVIATSSGIASLERDTRRKLSDGYSFSGANRDALDRRGAVKVSRDDEAVQDRDCII